MTLHYLVKYKISKIAK